MNTMVYRVQLRLNLVVPLLIILALAVLSLAHSSLAQAPICTYVSGSASAGQVAYWQDSSTLTGSSNLLWDSTNNELNASKICLTGLCLSAWPAGGGGWATSGTYVYNNTAGVKVGIGTAQPTNALDVVGNVNATGNISVNGGTNIVYRCTTGAGTLPLGALTINTNNCVGILGYSYQIIQNNTDQEVISVNDTGGVKGSILWALTMNDSFVNSTLANYGGTITINNGTSAKFWENDSNPLTGNSPSNIWSQTGAVGVWHLSEGSGTTTADSSGNGNTGTLTNGSTWVTGKFGDALSFGTSNYVSAGTASSLDIFGSAFTISLWVKIATQPSGQAVLYIKGANTFANNGGGLVYVSNGYSACTSSYCVDLVKFGVADQDIAETLTTGTWHHVVAVQSYSSGSPSSWTLYVDNVVIGTTGSSSSYESSSGQTAYIGGSNSATGCQCSLDEVRIYNRALSATEIQNMYYNGIGNLTRLGAQTTLTGSGGYADTGLRVS